MKDRRTNRTFGRHIERACSREVCDGQGDTKIRRVGSGCFSDEDGDDWRVGATERAWKLHVMLIADPNILNERPLKIGQFIL